MFSAQAGSTFTGAIRERKSKEKKSMSSLCLVKHECSLALVNFVFPLLHNDTRIWLCDIPVEPRNPGHRRKHTHTDTTDQQGLYGSLSECINKLELCMGVRGRVNCKKKK